MWRQAVKSICIAVVVIVTDIIPHIFKNFIIGIEILQIKAFCLVCAAKSLNRPVIQTSAHTRHARCETVLFLQAIIVMRGVLETSVTMQKGRYPTVPPIRLLHRIHDQFVVVGVAKHPRYEGVAIYINNRAQIRFLTVPILQLGDICAPLLIRSSGLHVYLEIHLLNTRLLEI